MNSEAAQHGFYSPLRYPGGKGRIANFVKLLLLKNDCVGGEYHEVYAGGASVALALLYEQYATRVHINDVNRSVHSFWDAALNKTDGLCKLIRDTEVTFDEWQRQREIQRATQVDPLSLAFSTFFLNRTNRSGIIRAGVIGGKAQGGRWKLDARYNKADLIRRIEKIGRHKSQISLTRLDASDVLRTLIVSPPSKRSFVYLDPPYYCKGGDLYENAYGASDHETIATLVAQLQCHWLVSYDAVDEILALYASFSGMEYTLSYSAQTRYRGSEAMFFSPNTAFEGLAPSPATVPSSVVALRKATALIESGSGQWA